MTTYTATISGSDCYDWHCARGLLPAPAQAVIELPADYSNRWGESPVDYHLRTIDFDSVSDLGEGYHGFAIDAECSWGSWTVKRFEPIPGCEDICASHYGPDWRTKLRSIERAICDSWDDSFSAFWARD